MYKKYASSIYQVHERPVVAKTWVHTMERPALHEKWRHVHWKSFVETHVGITFEDGKGKNSAATPAFEMTKWLRNTWIIFVNLLDIRYFVDFSIFISKRPMVRSTTNWHGEFLQCPDHQWDDCHFWTVRFWFHLHFWMRVVNNNAGSQTTQRRGLPSLETTGKIWRNRESPREYLSIFRFDFLM